MFSFGKPSVEVVGKFLDRQRYLDFTYVGVGATASSPPAGFVVDRTRARLGHGERVFQAAKAGLERWQQFQLGWVEAMPPRTSIRPGEVVAIMARVLGVWCLNACRIVYVVDEQSPVRRFGFAYGTLPDHMESGEERFLLEWNPDDGSVWYDILAFSRPKHLLAKAGYPFVRRMQKRFARDSSAAMMRATGCETAR